MNYKQKYKQYKAQVDQEMGHGLGYWGGAKAKLGFFSKARKTAIDNAEKRHENFYKPENVIGVTGTGEKATVYYRNSNGDFGHITTDHIIKANIGREKIRNHPGYSFGNTGKNGTLEEKIGNKVIHPSRNAFIPVSDIKDPQTQQRINTAHTTFTNVKDPQAIKREKQARKQQKNKSK